MKKRTAYFSKGELILWGSSVGLILVSFLLFDRENFLTASLIGTASLIFNTKAIPLVLKGGQNLMINAMPESLSMDYTMAMSVFFIFEGNKYFLQGYYVDGKPMLEMYVVENPTVDFAWSMVSNNSEYPVEEFENTKIFNGKSFWEIEKEIEWIDC